MPFFSERKRLAELVTREQQGESLWTGSVPDALRVKIDTLYMAAEQALMSRILSPMYSPHPVYSIAGNLLTSDLGVHSLTGRVNAPDEDFARFIAQSKEQQFPDVLEAFQAAMAEFSAGYSNQIIASVESGVNQLLNSYRINYSLEQGAVVPFESREMHVAVVVPALSLLASAAWDTAEQPYRGALKDLADGKYSRAITSATTALQEGLRIAGCKGGDLKTLMASAKTKLFTAYDGKYVDGIDKLIEWSSATRANKGDVHKTGTAEADDAWLVLHLVGALLLRISRIEGSSS